MLHQSRRPAAWLTELLAAATVMSGVGYLLTAYSISRWLTRPSRARPRPSPGEINLPFEDVHCVTRDGFRLGGWVISPANPRGTVALFHGMRHNRAQTLSRIGMLTEAGYRCVAFDHRGHGQSPGRLTSFGYHEGHDVAAVMDFVSARWPCGFRAAIGISMGAAALCFAGHHVGRLDACILESLYHDVASAFTTRIGTAFPAWFRRFAGGVVWVTEIRLGVKLAQVAPADHIANLGNVPLLLVTGSADANASPADQERLGRRCCPTRELAQIEGADHTNLCSIDGGAYQRLVLGFLERHHEKDTDSPHQRKAQAS